jgi:hypothetical protein
MQTLAKKCTERGMADCLYRHFSEGLFVCRVVRDRADTSVPKLVEK